MKIGDLVRKNFTGRGWLFGSVVDIATALDDIDGEEQVVEVVWPGCAPFWTSSSYLEAVA